MSYRTGASTADANVFWHAGSVLALAESGLPQRFSRDLEPEEFDGGLSRPVASHVHLDPATGARVLFGVEPGDEAVAPGPAPRGVGRGGGAGPVSRRGPRAGHLAARHRRDRPPCGLHGVPHRFVMARTRGRRVAVPYRWTPGAEGWIGVVDRTGDGTAVRWIRQDPCLVTHVFGAYDEEGGGGHGGTGGLVGLAGRGPVGPSCSTSFAIRCPSRASPSTCDSSVVGPAGVGESLIGGGLGVLERWRIEGTTCEQVQVDDRVVEYVQADPSVRRRPFRYGYGVEVAPAAAGLELGQATSTISALLQFDVARDEVRSWRPGEYRVASEPLFVRAADGEGDDEGWLLTVVHDATRGASDVYVLDASSFGRRAPQAVIHLPAACPSAATGRGSGPTVTAERCSLARPAGRVVVDAVCSTFKPARAGPRG